MAPIIIEAASPKSSDSSKVGQYLFYIFLDCCFLFLIFNIITDMLQHEIIEVQLRYQKELERLEKENKELRKQLLLKNSQKINMRKVKVSEKRFDQFCSLYNI